jgi:hypothetical protein
MGVVLAQRGSKGVVTQRLCDGSETTPNELEMDRTPKAWGHALRTQEHVIANTTNKGLTATPANVCTRVCTSNADSEQFTAELQVVIDAWPGLPQPMKTAILAVVKASSE